MITLLKALLILALPVVAFFGGVAIMKKVTGREAVMNKLAVAPEAHRKPLNQRWRGYDVDAVAGFWGALDPDTRARERQFLELDLVFPFCYGGALTASLLLAWVVLGRPFHPAWLIAPVAVTVLADWTENLVQLGQLARYSANHASLQSGWIRVASAATVVKLTFFVASSVLLVALALWWSVGPRRA